MSRPPEVLSSIPDETAPDRLVSTVFLATIIHGIVIMGVTFGAGTDDSETPTLRVTVVASADEQANDEAGYLANVDHTGAGDESELDVVGGLASEPVPRQLPPEEASQSPVLAARPQDADALQAALERRVEHEPSPPDTAELLPSDDALITDSPNLASTSPLRERVVSIDTRESTVAVYLSAWKSKIERVGTLNYPAGARREGLSGNPRLEVAIRSDGSLHDVILRRTSGYAALDEAAVRILRLAAPFEPFPEEIRAEYDVLRFVYDWEFLDGVATSGAPQLL